MATYLIAELIEVNDAEGLARYGRAVGATIARHGGEFVARGAPVTIEGIESPQTAVIIRFDSLDQLRSWYDSDDYAPLLRLRQESATYNLYAVEGV
ncbi:MAG TPA: DUF1330 domain-containing protein [Thermomicrobiaceae bacterium]|nr:DUF1330 domain-containing protein [Thermomicrobiaceae bacterium]